MTPEQKKRYQNMIASGRASCVVADENELLYEALGTGAFPLLNYVMRSERAAAPVYVFDKVLGSAAAILALRLSPAYVYGQLMSDGALALLRKHGVCCEYRDRTDKIMNRTQTGLCPLEQRTLGITDLEEGMRVIEEWRAGILKAGGTPFTANDGKRT